MRIIYSYVRSLSDSFNNIFMKEQTISYFSFLQNQRNYSRIRSSYSVIMAKSYKVQFNISTSDHIKVEEMAKAYGFSSVPSLMKFLFIQLKEKKIDLVVRSEINKHKYDLQIEASILEAQIDKYQKELKRDMFAKPDFEDDDFPKE